MKRCLQIFVFCFFVCCVLDPRGWDQPNKDKVTVVLHLDPRLVEELRVAQKSRNNRTLEDYIRETLECAVSDPECLPRQKNGN